MKFSFFQKVFDFSYVFDMNSCLDSVYESAVSQLVAQAVDGYNVCVMAYGQTGSGKTYWFVFYFIFFLCVLFCFLV